MTCAVCRYSPVAYIKTTAINVDLHNFELSSWIAER